jgi:acetolactate synthase-1/2/3 large subunit
MLRFDQHHVGDDIRGVDLARPDFVRLAESFGIKGDVVTDVGEPLAAALRVALSSGEPRMVVLETAMTPPRTTSPRLRFPPNSGQVIKQLWLHLSGTAHNTQD